MLSNNSKTWPYKAYKETPFERKPAPDSSTWQSARGVPSDSDPLAADHQNQREIRQLGSQRSGFCWFVGLDLPGVTG